MFLVFFFQADVRTNTTASIDPVVTGTPTGKGYCTTPFEIIFSDSIPVQVRNSTLCGWVINRTWSIRPVYKDCLLGVPHSNPLSSSRIQHIQISDITPPVFVPTPDVQVRIPFFRNYRSTAAIPDAEDRALSPYFQNLGLVMPTTLMSDDSAFVAATETGTFVQSQRDGLARFTRLWYAIFGT